MNAAWTSQKPRTCAIEKYSLKKIQAVSPASTRTISSGAAARVSRSGGTVARTRQRGQGIAGSVVAAPVRGQAEDLGADGRKGRPAAVRSGRASALQWQGVAALRSGETTLPGGNEAPAAHGHHFPGGSQCLKSGGSMKSAYSGALLSLRIVRSPRLITNPLP